MSASSPHGSAARRAPAIERILCVVDPTAEEQPALARAAWIARSEGATVELLVCFYDEYLAGTRFYDAESLRQMRESAMAGLRERLAGYAAPLHTHPYIEILHILDGVAEAWTEGKEDQPIRLEKGDTIALPPELPHAFRVVGDQTLRLLGTHVSPRRIVNYRDGGLSDARGYRAEPR